ncbi:hypothetical protein ACSQ67_006536 [Phaseolus vulgaris]
MHCSSVVYSLNSNMRLGTTEPIPTPFFSCRRHFPTLQLHIPAGPTSRRRRRNWVVYSSRQKPPTPIYSSVIERALRRGIWPTRFDILWKWLSRLVSFYLLSLNLAVAASDYPTPSSYPSNKEAAFDTETDKQKWAPPMQVRGDIARALMYMAVCYGFQQPGQSPSLRLSDTPNSENREMGLLSILLKWNEVDPPSREEKLRNERICKFYQHNRNPFIDHPEYVNLIWK